MVGSAMCVCLFALMGSRRGFSLSFFEWTCGVGSENAVIFGVKKQKRLILTKPHTGQTSLHTVQTSEA